ncbi:MAG: hypothetical protein EXS31_04855 [Pedosphaera sp.]|nr:hypothetical protein [Pedosphaera sp.]
MKPFKILSLAIFHTVLWCQLVTAATPGLTLERDKHWLIIHGDHVFGGPIRINYLEAYCRDKSTDADWVKHTMVAHSNALVSISADKKVIKMRDVLADGLIVDHTITAGDDSVVFKLTARNPTQKRSEAHWAQPCIRLGDFTGQGAAQTKDDYAYVPKCFIFLDGKLTRLPTDPWATKARYMPGQVWRAPNVSAEDVNPRPLNPKIPSSGLIGCYSGDDKWIFATAWEPWQELFQGVARCLHSDFRLGGIPPGEEKTILGKIYIVPADVPALLKRYEKDFPGR